ncbi:MAG: trypsin-like serine protease [Deltaproteobacteria bacterium]|nr:trypsin-like serine protease [Deltaproteobacteria bacterium]
MDHAKRALVWAALLVGLVVVGDARAAEQRSAAPATANIVNGIRTNMQPTTGALLYVGPDIKNQFLECSGVLIGCRTFLTSAHCLCTQSNNYAACAQNELANIDPADLRVFFQHAGIFHVRELYVSPTYLRGKRSDLMLLRLSERVDGIEPAVFNQKHGLPLPLGTSALIAGFGNTGDDRLDAAIKRVGNVETARCPFTAPEPDNICWDFVEPIPAPGQESNVCFKDDGGPLFIDFGSGPEVAGIHSGGSSTCDADAFAFDSDVYRSREWIRTVGGRDVTRKQCSNLGEVGDNFVFVDGDSGMLPRSDDEARFSFEVPEGTELLRVTVNGDTEKTGDYDMFVGLDSLPTKVDYDCKSSGVGQFGICAIENPDAAFVNILIRHVKQHLGRGKSRFQVTVTAFLPRPADGPTPWAPERLRYEVRSEERRRLTWKDMSRNEDGFELQRSSGQGDGVFSTRAVLKANRTFYVDVAKPDKIFAYRVRSFNEHGASEWSNLCLVNRPAPLAPRRLRAENVKFHRLTVRWNDRSDDESGFQLQRRMQGDEKWDTVATLGANTVTYDDEGLDSATTYEYRVRALGHGSICVPDSNYSSKLEVTTQD